VHVFCNTQINETFYESALTVLQVDQFDYGDYVCTASNALGSTSSINRLTVFSHPDPPLNFRLVNSTHNSVILTWSPGFDGGMYDKINHIRNIVFVFHVRSNVGVIMARRGKTNRGGRFVNIHCFFFFHF